MASPGSKAPAALIWPFKTVYYGWGVASVSLLMSFATVQMYGPVLSVWVKPIGDDMGWSRTEISIAFTIGSFLGTVLTAATGRVLDKRGARAVTTVSAMLIAGLLVGLALMQSPWQMWIFFGLGRGMALAGVQLGTTVAVANWFVQKRGSAIAMAAFGQRFGQAVVPLLILPIMLTLSWRHAYGVLALSTVLLAALPAFLFIRRRPEDYGMLPDGVKPGVTATASQLARAAADAIPWTAREAMRTRAFWLIVATMTCVGFAQTAVNLHAAASFQEKGISYAASTSIVFIFAITSASTTFIWGWLVDRIGLRFVMMASAVFYMAAMFVITNASTYPGAIAFGLVFGTASGAWTIGNRLLVPNYFGRRSTGTVRGATAPFNAAVGPLGPTVAGAIYDATGSYSLAFLIFAGVFALAFVAMALARPPVHHSTRAAEVSAG